MAHLRHQQKPNAPQRLAPAQRLSMQTVKDLSVEQLMAVNGEVVEEKFPSSGIR
jgi:hypothetical protein